ncbi:hypothetical protein GCM10010452_12030 [Crossiella cryophila]
MAPRCYSEPVLARGWQVSAGRLRTGTGDNSCGVPLPEALRLHQAKVLTRQALGGPAVQGLPEAFTKAAPC